MQIDTREFQQSKAEGSFGSNSYLKKKSSHRRNALSEREANSNNRKEKEKERGRQTFRLRDLPPNEMLMAAIRLALSPSFFFLNAPGRAKNI